MIVGTVLQFLKRVFHLIIGLLRLSYRIVRIPHTPHSHMKHHMSPWLMLVLVCKERILS